MTQREGERERERAACLPGQTDRHTKLQRKSLGSHRPASNNPPSSQGVYPTFVRGLIWFLEHAHMAGPLGKRIEPECAEWAEAQEEVVRELGQALQGDIDQEEQVAQAVERAVQQYQRYFEATETSSQRIYTLLSSPLMSPLERAFMWLGGPRPSIAFQLLYALTGHLIQAELEELLELAGAAVDGRPASLASLSAAQLAQLSDLQTSTIKEEDMVDKEMVMLQQSVGDQPLHHISGSTSSTSAASSPAADDDSISKSKISMDSAISNKLASLQEICARADALRLNTLNRVLELLHSPLQKAQYLHAAAKLQVALRKLGQAKPTSSARRRG